MSVAAIEDLATIWNRAFSQSSKEAAEGVYTNLIAHIRTIQADFTVGNSMESERDGYWKLMVGDYVIYYRADRDDVLEVVRVI